MSIGIITGKGPIKLSKTIFLFCSTCTKICREVASGIELYEYSEIKLSLITRLCKY